MEELVASTLARELKVPHLVARFLVSRGVKNVADAYKFLYGSDSDIADPMLMKGMGEAVEWLLDVQKSGEEIFIFGDYDLDGMTSVTLLSKALAEALFGDENAMIRLDMSERRVWAVCQRCRRNVRGRCAQPDYGRYRHHGECRNSPRQGTWDAGHGHGSPSAQR